MTTCISQFKLISLLVLLAPLSLCSAFVVPTTSSVAFVTCTGTATATATSTFSIGTKPSSAVTLAMHGHDSSQLLAADTIDPTTVLSDVLGGVMNSPGERVHVYVQTLSSDIIPLGSLLFHRF